MKLLKRLFKNEREIIQEIHNSFDNAQENLLKEAEGIIMSHSKCLNPKADRLEKLGFKNCEAVVQNLKAKKQLISSKQDAELVSYYKHTYPLLKFLKEEQLDFICKKYRLIYAPVERYKKDVPEKNVTEIENAKPLLDNDRPLNLFTVKVESVWHEAPEDLKLILINGFTVPHYHFSVRPSDREILRLAKEYGGYKGNYNGYTVEGGWIGTITEVNKEGLFIAAPHSHFDLEKLKNIGYGFMNFKITEVEDPIVFRYVKGGVQVLSKWGLESSDKVLLNEIFN
ncbi:MAG: hypothetical protein ACRBFS_20940 [Aureispira sp.]